MPKFGLQVLGSFQTELNNKARIGNKTTNYYYKIAAFSPIARFWHKSERFFFSRTEKNCMILRFIFRVLFK